MKTQNNKSNHHESIPREKNDQEASHKKTKQHNLNFDNFEWLNKHKYILEILDDAKFVGGAVKNSLLSLPINDFDVATSHSPEDVTKICQNHGLSVIPTGLSHGTVTVMINGVGYEVTTLRSDVKTDGRHASVEFIKDWRHDAERRDFTINAVYLDKNGEFLDFFNGVKDLRNGIIRFIGSAEKRIQEDYLRILRFFRFFVGYGIGGPNEEALFFCEKYAHCLRGISIERITKEIMTLLSYRNLENLQTGICAMHECGVLKEVFFKESAFKEGSLSEGTLNVSEFRAFLDFENCILDNDTLERDTLQRYTASSALLRLFMLSPENWSNLCLSNSQKKHIVEMQKAEKAMARIFDDLFGESFDVQDAKGAHNNNHRDHRKDSKNNNKRLQILLPLIYSHGREAVLDGIMLCFYSNLSNIRSDKSLSGNTSLSGNNSLRDNNLINNLQSNSQNNLRNFSNSALRNVLKYVECASMPVFPLLGRDLMNIGIPAGKEIGQIMQKVTKEWLNGNCKMTKDECVELAKKYYKFK